MASADQQRDNGERAQRAASGNQEDGQPESAVTLPVEQPTGQPEPGVANQQAQSEQPPPHELRDLAAQEDMAFWAMFMFFAAVATFIVTSIGTLLIWRQVKLTREAVEDTGKATLAMERQNDLTAQAQRPWIDLDIEFQFISESQGGLLLVCNAVLKNIGSTPATGALVWHIPATSIRNPIFDLQITAEAPFEEIREGDETLIVLPGGVARQQIFVHFDRANPHNHAFDHGVVPSLLLVADYTIPNGERVRSAAWFTVAPSYEEVEGGLVPWDLTDFDPKCMSAERHGYIAVT